MYGYNLHTGLQTLGMYASKENKVQYEKQIEDIHKRQETAGGKPKELQVATSGNCGITLVTGLPVDLDHVTCGAYPVQFTLPFDAACRYLTFGNYDTTTGARLADNPSVLKHLESKAGRGPCYMFTDVDGIRKGNLARDWLIKKGYKVDTIEVGPNYNHPQDMKYHHIRVYLWYDYSEQHKFHPVNRVYECIVNQTHDSEEQKQEEKKPDAQVHNSDQSGIGDRITAAAEIAESFAAASVSSPEAGVYVPQPRRTTGEGVRRAGPARSPSSVRRLARGKTTRL